MANVLKTESIEEKKNAVRNVTGLAGFNLDDLVDEGRLRLEECRQQIRQMMEQAQQEVKKIHQAADQRGYQEGLKRAAAEEEQKVREQSERRAREGLRLISQAVQQLHVTYEQWMQKYAESLHHIAIESAQLVVRNRLEKEPDLLVQWAADALKFTRSSTQVVLAMHPETLAMLGPAFDEMLHSSDLPEQTTIEPDESVDRDSVVVRQEGGDIQAGLQSQLARLGELLT
ncbi:MAG: FliH/SctL family protein [Rubripirellula sp.]|jgi:flagellar assembly protein FliH|nr:FliH/SctL family protein [Rubripirellula sp.]